MGISIVMTEETLPPAPPAQPRSVQAPASSNVSRRALDSAAEFARLRRFFEQASSYTGPEEQAVRTPAASPALGVRPGTAAEFARLRGFFEQASYTEGGVCERAGCATVHELGEPDRGEGQPIRDRLDALMRLFIHGQRLPAAEVHEHLSSSGVELLERFGLLAGDPGDPDLCHAPLALYPLRGMYLVSDQKRILKLPPNEVPDDFVHSALTPATGEFMRGLPETPCDSLLDIGTGNGVAALHAASRYARHAWAADIAERSVRVTEFNAAMNGIDNVTALQGDLYEPAGNLTFDRIVAHPPFMPALETRLILRDGGEDGEQLTRRIIQGLPQRLRPGGRFCCRALGTDRTDAALEHRLRVLLGDAHEEFDIFLLAGSSSPPARFLFRMIQDRMIAGGTPGASTLDRQIQSYEGLGIESVLMSFVWIERHSARREPLTVRRRTAGDGVPLPAAVEWLIRWERAGQGPEASTRLRAARPRVSPHAQVRLVHQVREGQLRATAGSAATQFPFRFTMELTPGQVQVLAHCDGTRTVEQLHREMGGVGAIPPDTPIDEFVQVVRQLIGGAVLEIDEFRLPASPVAGGS
jgi:SAM-dependent methyltransferase